MVYLLAVIASEKLASLYSSEFIYQTKNELMANIESHTNDLQKWINFIKKSVVAVYLIEILIVALLGIASSNFIDKVADTEGKIKSSINTTWCYFLVFSIILYLAIQIFKILNQKLFPDKATSAISESYELAKFREQNTRKDIVNESFTRTLITLNNTSCDYLNNGLSDDITSKSIEDSLRSLLKYLISNLNTILEIDKSKYTVGAYLKDLPVIPSKPIYELDETPSTTAVFTIEDSLNVEQICIPKNVMNTTQHPDCVIDIKGNIMKSLSKKGFHTGTFTEGNYNYAIHCNFIPVYCDEDTEAGCLFIISEASGEVPYDLQSILNVYCRIISNWMVNRQNCIINKVAYDIEVYTCCPPPETQE